MRQAILSLLLLGTMPAAWTWQPAPGPLKTRWTDQIQPDHALPEYPRPTMVRDRWLNLNGLWEYAVTPRDAGRPGRFQGEILVPFPIESSLSGVKRRVTENERLWYRRRFEVPAAWKGHRVLLHFGAVDFEATVWVNGRQVGLHRGGYDAFEFDVTDFLQDGPNELLVAVWDPTDAGYQPRGKQVRNPHGIWYTPSTGIWQTVWLEPVAPAHIQRLRIVPDWDHAAVTVRVEARTPIPRPTLHLQVLDGHEVVAEAQLRTEVATVSETPSITPSMTVRLRDPKPWSPEHPFLYGLRVRLLDGDQAMDEVRSYFGLRKVSLGKDAKGFTRILLNNEPLFQYGPLDQGFWPDGLYTAPTDEALRFDIEQTKSFGMNMARKHVKVEPERWYYWCDKLGLLVWQDMPSGNFGGRDDARRSDEASAQYELELRRLVEGRFNHPCIIMWIPFNEGWGQHETARYVELVKRWDPTRLVNEASGWHDRGSGDVKDIHAYPGPRAPEPEQRRASVLGEFGGLGLPVRGHTWQAEENWGYRSFTDAESLTDAYLALLRKLHPLVGTHGLSAAVYTQTTDVESEVNGLMTYDRQLVKMDRNRIRQAVLKLYGPPPPPPVLTPLVPTAREEAALWRYTTNRPGPGWEQPDFDDSSWAAGKSGFGTKGTPGAVVRTVWNTPEIWLRREFTLPAEAIRGELQLLVHHDEDAEVYVNGERVLRLRGYLTDYELAPTRRDLKALLRPGRNVLAVHCRQTGGGQYIDLGIVRVSIPEAE